MFYKVILAKKCRNELTQKINDVAGYFSAQKFYNSLHFKRGTENMPSIRMTLELSDEVFEVLTARAEALMVAEAPLTQYEWLHGTPEGRELWVDISCRGKYNSLNNQDLNSLIRKQYRAAVGDVGLGRPPIGIYRAKAAVEYINQGLRTEPLRQVPPRPSTTSANWADQYRVAAKGPAQ